MISTSETDGFSNATEHLRDRPSTTSNCLLTRSTVPDSDRLTLHRGFAAECACVPCMLRNFHLFDLFSEGGAISAKRTVVISCESSGFYGWGATASLVLNGNFYRNIPGTVFPSDTDFLRAFRLCRKLVTIKRSRSSIYSCYHIEVFWMNELRVELWRYSGLWTKRIWRWVWKSLVWSPNSQAETMQQSRTDFFGPPWS